MLVVVLLIIGMVKVFAWTGRDLLERRQAHEAQLTVPVSEDSGVSLVQTRPFFFDIAPINAAVESNMWGSN